MVPASPRMQAPSPPSCSGDWGRRLRLDPEKYGRLLSQAEHDYQLLGTGAGFFPHKKAVYAHGLEMTTVLLNNATGGYGGAHCMTCVIAR